MVPVETEFELDIQHDQEEKSDAQSQSSNIDEGVDLLPFDVPPCRDGVVTRHDEAPINQKLQVGRDGFEHLMAIPASGFADPPFGRFFFKFFFEITCPKKFLIVPAHSRTNPFGKSGESMHFFRHDFPLPPTA
jgi:hypothetical protein